MYQELAISEADRLRGLLQKYDQPGPRYTSYPTAPLFNTAFGAPEFAGEIKRMNAPRVTSDLSLYFHFPFCDTLCYFCGCTMLVSNNRERIKEYLEYLKHEIDMYASLLFPDRAVAQMHWGGGTPTHLQPGEIADIASYILSRFNFHEDAEISVEIDPRALTYEHLVALRENGFNRVSLGVQDFNGDVQRAVNRVQPEYITHQTVAWCRELGFSSINIDLIYGLPLQTVESFEKTLDKVIAVSPDRIAAYSFAHVPWLKPHQNLIDPASLPSPATKLNVLLRTIEKLTDAGYVYIGMDHFAKETDELTIAQRNKSLYRSFQGYTTKAGCDLYGLGMSAISNPAGIYAQNAKTLKEYYTAIESGALPTASGYRMTTDDIMRKRLIMQIMCDLYVPKSEYERDYGISFDSYFAESLAKLEPLIDDGLVFNTSSALHITPAGRLFLRNIAMCFDAHLATRSPAKPVYSRTV